MAKKDQEELQHQARVLASYSETDLSPSQVKLVEPLLARMMEDRTLATKVLKTFESVVDKVPSKDRAVLLKWVIASLLIVIMTGMALKAFGLW